MEKQIGILDDIYVDCFAGGGGASTGIELATGHPVNIAINHDEAAILLHKRNHPFTEHFREDIRMIDPAAVTRGRHVRLAWFSPDCKHFSRAKGAALVDRHIRGLAWMVLRWAGTVRPDVIMLENVPEFVTWGPVRKGRPVKSKAGQTYRKWRGQLEALGYIIETRELCAADFGAATIRTRFCLVARCDGKKIVWPERTHAPRDSEDVRAGRYKPWSAAYEVIDFSMPCPSIFDGKADIKRIYGLSVQRPLAANTMRRIARGLDKFVLRCAEPYIVQCKFDNAPQSLRSPLSTVTSVGAHMLVTPALIQYHAEQSCREVRGQSVTAPLMTLDAANRYGLMSAYLTKYFGHDGMTPVTEPHATMTTRDREGLCAVYLAHFKGQDKGQSLRDPLMTITAATGQFALVKTVIVKRDNASDLGHWPEVRDMLNTYCGYALEDDDILLLAVGAEQYMIADIGLRMLTPREMYDAQGFPHDYIIDRYADGTPIPRAEQVAKVGNSVCPPLAEALVRANLPEMCTTPHADTMRELHEEMAG